SGLYQSRKLRTKECCLVACPVLAVRISITHPGRTKFTLAHELGHYFVHRNQMSQSSFECGESDMLDGNQDVINIETEANIFAANLLMPNHDFREQITDEPFSFDLMQHCASRYDVSLTAVVLKWLEFSKKEAIAILSEDGFMHWSKSNNRAYRAGKYFATRKECIEIPIGSMTAEARYTLLARNGVKCKAGIWFPNTEVQEFSIYSTEHGKALTVLILEDSSSGYHLEDDSESDEQLLVDTATKISSDFSLR
ncbi:ImmA/IrrE family metallo-endopeptidase, partial [Shewanella algae]|uniref:ImmA/IrrE family metallo-endopeptidase n=2 Tax=Shewanella algae TaxID=38313 RepID=UPI001C5935CC